MTPIDRKLAEAAVARGEALLREFDVTEPGTPLHWVLRRAKKCSSEAMQALTTVSPHDPHKIAALQNEANRYSDLVSFIHETIRDAEEAHHALEEEDREDILSIMERAAEEGGSTFEEG